MGIRTAPAMVLGLAWTFSGCVSERPDAGVIRTDSAGVEIVLSMGGDAPLEWSIERIFALGGEEVGPQSFDIVTAGSVGIDAEGLIRILDLRARRILVFTAEGAFVREFGREGEGPGEMSNPASLAVSPTGSISVFDYGRGGLVRFGPLGEVLPTVPFPFYPSLAQPRHIAYSGVDLVVASQAFAPAQEATDRFLLQRISSTDTVMIADRHFPKAERAMYPECGGGLTLPRLFEDGIAWAALGTSIVLNRHPSYDLEQIESGTLVRRIRRDLSTRDATDDMALAELGEGFRIDFGRGSCTIPPRVMVDRRGFAPQLPWIAGVTLVPGGELWVQRREAGAETASPIDVFDPSGAYLGTLPVGTPFPIVFIDQDRFGVAETDEFDITRFVVYRLIRS